MNAEFKRVWVQALRSGKYKQGTCSLKQDDTFCCLGVLAEVCGVNWKTKEIGGEQGVLIGTLTPPFREVVGLDDTAQRLLIIMNDKKRASFNEIADYIERHL